MFICKHIQLPFGLNPPPCQGRSITSANSGQWQRALSLLKAMCKADETLDVISFICAISVCKKDGQWKRARLLFHHLVATVNYEIVYFNVILMLSVCCNQGARLRLSGSTGRRASIGAF